MPDGLKQTNGIVRELLHFNAFVTVMPESDQDAERSIAPEVDDLRTQAELASPGQGELGKRTYGFWQCPDGFIKWGMGIVSDVAEDVVLALVEAGREVQVETFTGRDPARGTKPALGFQ
jgi:endo-beta-N-acetylglucosaminidase D